VAQANPEKLDPSPAPCVSLELFRPAPSVRVGTAHDHDTCTPRPRVIGSQTPWNRSTQRLRNDLAPLSISTLTSFLNP
jgi:hypothetical protein